MELFKPERDVPFPVFVQEVDAQWIALRDAVNALSPGESFAAPFKYRPRAMNYCREVRERDGKNFTTLNMGGGIFRVWRIS